MRSLTIPIVLRSSQTGLTLTGKLFDADGVQSGSDLTTGFVEVGSGLYEWRGDVADDFSGSLRVFSGATPLAATGIDALPAQVDLSPVTDALTAVAADLSLVLGLVGRNVRVSEVQTNDQGQVVYAKLRLYSSPEAAESQDEEGLLAAYTSTSNFDAQGRLTSELTREGEYPPPIAPG